MKTTMAFLFTMALSTAAFSATDLGNFSNLDGKTGTGRNDYEKGSFACTVNVDKSENTLTITQPAAYYSTVIILGDEVEYVTTTETETIIETNKTKPFKSGLCGDYVSARKVSTAASISSNKVIIAYKYTCGFKKYQDTFTCNLK